LDVFQRPRNLTANIIEIKHDIDNQGTALKITATFQNFVKFGLQLKTLPNAMGKFVDKVSKI